MLRTYKDLLVWQRSFELVARIYEVPRKLPDEEKFRLISQMRRAAVSIPSNIAEGYARDSTRDYVRLLWIAKGSLAELETQVMLSKRLALLGETDTETILNELGDIERMLAALVRKLRARSEQ
ncbi:MAG: four helix bundle protein [Phycisphaerae bacterium]